MGNATKIGLVLVLVLVVVVIANLLDNEVEKGLDGKDQAPNIEGPGTPRGAITPAGRPQTPPASPGARDEERTTRGYDSGRDRRLASRGAEEPSRATPPSAPPSVLDERRGAGTTSPRGESARPDPMEASTRTTDPTGLRPSPTGVGLPEPLDASRDAARPAVGDAGTITPAVSRGEESGSTPRIPIVGRDPGATGPTPSTPAPATSSPTTAPGAATPPPARPEPASALAAGFPKEHVVAEGDILWRLAEKYYQRGALFTHIVDANPGLGTGDELPVGQKLKIPAPPASASPAKPLASAATAPAPTGPASPATAAKSGFRTYTIQDGDTLYDIAEDRLGSGNRWTEIQSANPGLDPSRLRVGATIQIPMS